MPVSFSAPWSRLAPRNPAFRRPLPGPALSATPILNSPAQQARFDPLRPLAFMHVPKTAGTSLMAALRELLAPCHAIGGFDRVLFGDFAEFATLGNAIRQEIHVSPDRLPAADLIAGHLAYSSLQQRYPNAQFVTVLREPFSRLLSHWLFWRGHSDEQLAPWGAWADRVRLSRLPLAAFLSSPSIACQTDNVAVRMLLWPHRWIPVDDFIDPRHDARLLAEASERLARFDLVDVLENPELPLRLQNWFGHALVLGRSNETLRMPAPLRRQLATEMNPEVFALLRVRSRLDLELWSQTARNCLPGHDPAQIREQAMLRNVARYAALMSVAPPAA